MGFMGVVMKRGLLTLLWIATMAFPLGLCAKYPAAAKGVYYGGMVHYVSVEDGNPPVVAHWAWTYDSNWHFNWDASPTATISLDKDAKRLDPDKHDHGQGVVCFNGILHHFAILKDANNNPALYLTRCDLTKNPVEFLDYRKLSAVKYPSGDVEEGGVAAAVLANTIYVFTDSFTLSSTDGISWTRLDGIVNNHIPLDAVTVYPPDAPAQILLLFMSYDIGSPGFGSVFWCGAGGPAPNYVNVDPKPTVRQLAAVVGTANSFQAGYYHPGATDAPCVQVLALTQSNWYDDDNKIRRYEYNLGSGTWSLDSWGHSTNSPIDRLRVAPWYESNVDPQDPGAVQEVQKQRIAVSIYECSDSFCIIHDHQYWAFASDVLVAQNQDPAQNGYGWQGVPTVTGDTTNPDLETLRKYWTLAGVVFGPPPFAVNDLDDFDIRLVSNVEYGSTESGSVSHKQVWDNSCMFSSGTKVTGGLGHLEHVEEELDLSYKHGWEHVHQDKSTQEMAFLKTFGTNMEAPGIWGTHGWAVFVCPSLVTQDYEVYAYDYDDASKTGSYLGQEMYTVATGTAAVRSFGFMLQDPGGDDDDLKGLMSGVSANPLSVDLKGWMGKEWEGADMDGRWVVIAGTGQHGGAQAPVVSQGQGDQCHFTKQTQTVDSHSETSDVEIKESTSIGVGLGIAGFKETLTAGYDSHYSAETEVDTEISTSIGYTLDLPYVGPNCTAPDCVKSLTVQPFLLQAVDSGAKEPAPWIPMGYDHQLPWCMTWQVLSFETVGGEKTGESAKPDMAGGTIIGELAGAGAGSRGSSEYTVLGGRMAWLEQWGEETPIPMTAKEFNRSIGAAVAINGRTFSCDNTSGKWKRHGKVWKFESPDSALREKVKLELDFGRGTWTFVATKADLSDVFTAGQTEARLELTVNGKYTFFCHVDHDIQADWDLALQASLPEALEVTHYCGSYNSVTGEGEAVVAGDLPESLESFGDFTAAFNGRPIALAILSADGFSQALETGGEFVYERGGVRFLCDFGQRSWELRVGGKDFHRLVAPLRGGARLQVKVGGKTLYDVRNTVLNYTEQLVYLK